MPAKKKTNTVTEYKPNDECKEIYVKSDIKRCKQVEETLNECDYEEISDGETNGSNETNDTKQSTSTKSDNKNKYDNIIYSPDTYVLKFGKYKGMKAKDVKNLEVEKMNKKSGETFMCNVWKQYLEFLLTLQWLCKSDKKVIAKIPFTD